MQFSLQPIFSYGAAVDIYDVSTATWTSTLTGAGELSVSRYGLAAAAAAAGNMIVFAGGVYVTSEHSNYAFSLTVCLFLYLEAGTLLILWTSSM